MRTGMQIILRSYGAADAFGACVGFRLSHQTRGKRVLDVLLRCASQGDERDIGTC